MTATVPAAGILHVVAGILLTRRFRSLFTVEASTEVPHGATPEKDRGHRPVLTVPAGAGDQARL